MAMGVIRNVEEPQQANENASHRSWSARFILKN